MTGIAQIMPCRLFVLSCCFLCLTRPVLPAEQSATFEVRPETTFQSMVGFGLVGAHACAWTYCFAIFTAQFQGSMGILAPADGEGPRQGELVVPKRFWALANYSRFARPGWKLMQIAGAGFANTGFVSPDGTRFAIVALNPSAQPQPTTYDFGNWTISAGEAFATSDTLNLARVPAPVTQLHRLTATLAPMSVTTFVGKLSR